MFTFFGVAYIFILSDLPLFRSPFISTFRNFKFTHRPSLSLRRFTFSYLPLIPRFVFCRIYISKCFSELASSDCFLFQILSFPHHVLYQCFISTTCHFSNISFVICVFVSDMFFDMFLECLMSQLSVLPTVRICISRTCF